MYPAITTQTTHTQHASVRVPECPQHMLNEWQLDMFTRTARTYWEVLIPKAW